MDPLTVLTGLVMAVGLAETLVPVLPGLALIWGAGLIYGLLTGFGAGGAVAMLLITVGLVAGAWVGLRIPQRRTAYAGVSVSGQVFAVSLAALGFFVIPIVGAFAGFVGGILLAQWTRTKDWSLAWVATKSAVGSMFRAAAAQFGIGAVMIAVWITWASFF